MQDTRVFPQSVSGTISLSWLFLSFRPRAERKGGQRGTCGPWLSFPSCPPLTPHPLAWTCGCWEKRRGGGDTESDKIQQLALDCWRFSLFSLLRVAFLLHRSASYRDTLILITDRLKFLWLHSSAVLWPFFQISWKTDQIDTFFSKITTRKLKH